MALVIVHVAGCAPVKFHSDQSGPFWSLVIARLETKHGPGIQGSKMQMASSFYTAVLQVMSWRRQESIDGQNLQVRLQDATHQRHLCDCMKVDWLSAGPHCHKIVLPHEPSFWPAKAQELIWMSAGHAGARQFIFNGVLSALNGSLISGLQACSFAIA